MEPSDCRCSLLGRSWGRVGSRDKAPGGRPGRRGALAQGLVCAVPSPHAGPLAARLGKDSPDVMDQQAAPPRKGRGG